MLDEYKEKQSLAYNLLSNEIVNNKLSHAYLIDDNNSNDSYGLALSFIKSILCENNKECGSCNICQLIDNESYPEVKFIRPDGLNIKKSQLLELQQDFSLSNVYGKKKIYIIFECDKMKSEAANSILKFLEEPNTSIIAILITNNFNNVLPTIISRCQIVRLNNENVEYLTNELEELSLKAIKSIENKGIYNIACEKSLIFDNMDTKNRDNLIVFVDNMVSMYYDILKIKINKEKEVIYSKYMSDLSEIAKNNMMEVILKKINILIECKDSIKFNVNVNLLIDNIIIKLGGYCEDSWC